MATKVPSTDFNVPWSQAVWLNPPAQVKEAENEILVTTDADTDFWRVRNCLNFTYRKYGHDFFAFVILDNIVQFHS